MAVRHSVHEKDIVECFSNRCGKFLIDTREDHKTNPPTKWFVAETDFGKKLKVVFINVGKDIHIKTAYAANSDEIRIYNNHGK